nr:MAG TPA: hypothetical protein [Caudoviricetes sp.]
MSCKKYLVTLRYYCDEQLERKTSCCYIEKHE